MAPTPQGGNAPCLRVPSMPKRFAKDRARRIEAIRAAAPKYWDPVHQTDSEPSATSLRLVPGPQNNPSHPRASSPKAAPPKVVKISQKQEGRLLIAATKKPGLQTLTQSSPRRLEQHWEANRTNVRAAISIPPQSQSQTLDAGKDEVEGGKLTHRPSSLVNGQQTSNSISGGKNILQELALLQKATSFQRTVASYPQQLTTFRPQKYLGSYPYSNKSSIDKVKRNASPTVDSHLSPVATATHSPKSVLRSYDTGPQAASPHIASQKPRMAVPVDVYDLPPDPDSDYGDVDANPTLEKEEVSKISAHAGKDNETIGTGIVSLKVKSKKPTVPQSKTYSRKKLAGKSLQQRMTQEEPPVTQHPVAKSGDDSSQMPALRRVWRHTSPQANTKVVKIKKSKSKNKIPRRLPVGELQIIAERLSNVDSSSIVDDTELSERWEDPISLGSPGEACTIYQAHRSRTSRKTLIGRRQPKPNTPESSAHRIPAPLTNGNINVPHLPSYRNGFEGKEACPMGKSLRVCNNARRRNLMPKMAVRFGVLTLGPEKYSQEDIQEEVQKASKPRTKHRYVEPENQELLDGDQKSGIINVRPREISVEQRAVLLELHNVQEAPRQEVRRDNEYPEKAQTGEIHHLHELVRARHESEDVSKPKQDSEHANNPKPVKEANLGAEENADDNTVSQLHDHEQCYENTWLPTFQLPTPSMSLKRTATESVIVGTPTRIFAHNSLPSPPPPRKCLRLCSASYYGDVDEEEENNQEGDDETSTDFAEEHLEEFNMQYIAPSSSSRTKTFKIFPDTSIDDIARRLNLVPISHLVSDVKKYSIGQGGSPSKLSNRCISMGYSENDEASDVSSGESDAGSRRRPIEGGEWMDMGEVAHDEQDEIEEEEGEELDNEEEEFEDKEAEQNDKIILGTKTATSTRSSPPVRSPQPSLHVRFGEVEYEPFYESRISDKGGDEYQNSFQSSLDAHCEVAADPQLASREEVESDFRFRILQDNHEALPEDFASEDELWTPRVPEPSSLSIEVDDEIAESPTPRRQQRTRSSSFRRSSSKYPSRTPSLNIVRRKPSPDLDEPVMDCRNHIQESVEIGGDVETKDRRSTTREIPETQYEQPTNIPEFQASFVPQELMLDYFETAAQILHTHTPIRRLKPRKESVPTNTASTSPGQENLTASSASGLHRYPQSSLSSPVGDRQKLPALMGDSLNHGKELERLTRQASQNFGTISHPRKTRMVSLSLKPPFQEVTARRSLAKVERRK